jgi:phytoene/squalene synthetase
MKPSRKRLIRLAKERAKTENSAAFYLARLLYDRGTLPLFCLGYAYFRWVDDFIDDPMHSERSCRAFITCQQKLIDAAYQGEIWSTDRIEEQMVQYLVEVDFQERLKPYIQDMLAALVWDTRRRGQFSDRSALQAYSLALGRAYTNALQAFVTQSHVYPDAPGRYAAGTAAHLVHLLRDFVQDWEAGYYNISRQEMAEFGLDAAPFDFEGEAFRNWVRVVAQRARGLFRDGQRYLDSLQVYRCKLLGYLYCVRYEILLDQIEHQGYRIAEGAKTPGRLLLAQSFKTLLNVSLQHFLQRRISRRESHLVDPSSFTSTA